MPRLPFNARSTPFALSPRLFIAGAYSLLSSPLPLRLSGPHSARVPSVTPEQFSFSGYLSLPRRTSATYVSRRGHLAWVTLVLC